MNKYSKIGAGFFILWGILHIFGGFVMIFEVYSNGLNAVLNEMGSGYATNQLPIVENDELVTNLFAFHMFNITWFGIVALIVAMKLNWKNSKIGFWFNFAIISFSDIGLIVFMLMTGNMNISDGFLGPLFWILGSVYGFIALKRK